MALTQRLREINNFVRNVFAHEDLEEAPALEVRAPARRQFAASIFGREALSLDPETARPPDGPGALRTLLAPEVLPEDPVAPPRPSPPGILSAIFGAEVLAEDPPAPPPPEGLGVLRALFAPEPLPELPAAPPRPRAAWLRWLFRFERLDPP